MTERLRYDGLTFSIDLRVHAPTPPAPELRIGYAADYTFISGRGLHVNLHDDRTATLSVSEKDSIGADIANADEAPVTFTADDAGAVITLTDNGDNTASVAVVGAASAGQTATVTATATLPDGRTAQGTVAIAVVTGDVAEITVDAVEDTVTSP